MGIDEVIYMPDQDEDFVAKPHWGCGCVIITFILIYLGYEAIIWLSTQTS